MEIIWDNLGGPNIIRGGGVLKRGREIQRIKVRGTRDHGRVSGVSNMSTIVPAIA